MKIFIFCILTFLFFSCKKDVTNGNATIVRNCTGTYLRIDGNDYLVCNSEKLKSFSDESSVSVSYETIESCDQNGVVCMMYYEHEGIVRVTKVH
jgi:hypothetical protein